MSLFQIHSSVCQRKKNWKAVNICGSYGQEFNVSFFFDSRCSLSLSLSSWHTLLECSHVHSRTPMFSTGCLLPRVRRTDVQWSQIRFSGSEPRVVGSSWRSFPVWWRLVNRSSNCTVMVFISSTACDVQPKNLNSRFVTMLESEGHPDIALTSTFWLYDECFSFS